MTDHSLKGVDLAIGILLILVITASLLPNAFDVWFNAPYYVVNETTGETATNWPAMLIGLWELIPLLCVLGVALIMYRKVDRDQ